MRTGEQGAYGYTGPSADTGSSAISRSYKPFDLKQLNHSHQSPRIGHSFAYRSLRRNDMSTSEQKKRSAAVTGAGSGLGRDIALGLAVKGYRVFGTAMSSEEIADLKKASGGAVNLTV